MLSFQRSMLDCTFLDNPAAARTVYRSTESDTPEQVSGPGALERAILAVLHKFPEAYRAVIEEMRRLDPLRDSAT